MPSNSLIPISSPHTLSILSHIHRQPSSTILYQTIALTAQTRLLETRLPKTLLTFDSARRRHTSTLETLLASTRSKTTTAPALLETAARPRRTLRALTLVVLVVEDAVQDTAFIFALFGSFLVQLVVLVFVLSFIMTGSGEFGVFLLLFML